MISVIVATRFASEFLDLLLESLLKFQKYDNEIIVIADTPSWQTLKLLQNKNFILGPTNNKKCYYITNNRHLEMNWNYGVEYAHYEYLGFSNDDVVIGPDWDVEIIKQMNNSRRKIVFLPQFQANIATDVNFRNFGAPEWKYAPQKREERINTIRQHLDNDNFDFNIGFNWNEFEKACRNPVIYGDMGVFWVLHKELFELVHRYTFSAPHPLGNEIAMFGRCQKIYNSTLDMVKTTASFHWGSIGNADNQIVDKNFQIISNGWFECNICKRRDLGVDTISYGRDPRSRLHLDTGLYLCEHCQKDGYKIEGSEIKKYERF